MTSSGSKLKSSLPPQVSRIARQGSSESTLALSPSLTPPPATTTTATVRTSTSTSTLRPAVELSEEELSRTANTLILNALERSQSHPVQSQLTHQSRGQVDSPSKSPPLPVFPKMSLSSFMPSLSLSRVSTNDSALDARGRQTHKAVPTSRSSSFARSLSPFHSHRRNRNRTERSPSVEALRQSQSDVDSESELPSKSIRPRNAFNEGDGSPDDDDDPDGDDDDGSFDDSSDGFDELTEVNTSRNAALGAPIEITEDPLEQEPDPLGEGVNVVRLPEPIFQQTLMGSSRRSEPRRRKSQRADPLPLITGRPHFQRDRCTVTLTHGNPAGVTDNLRPKTYMVASDLSEESRYAVEWGIGTVLKDGDEMIVVTVNETDNKLDPVEPDSHDRLAKLRNQQDRQALVNLLVRQTTSLLQRTKLHVTVRCQAIHAKNSRHMLLDIIDFLNPTMLIVGSRGIGKLKGILLGSTSHYLIQKSSVPVMVARRRLKRAIRRNPAIPPVQTRRVPLSEAVIEKAGPGKAEREVEQMRQELAQEEDERRHKKPAGGSFGTIPAPPGASGLGIDMSLTVPPEEESDSESEPEGIKVKGQTSPTSPTTRR